MKNVHRIGYICPNSESTVSSYVSIFETLWLQNEKIITTIVEVIAIIISSKLRYIFL
jgi:hypothetical protein